MTAAAIADEPDGRWEAGDTVEVTLAFAEPVAVGGAPSVGLVLGGAERRAAYAGGSGSEALTFGYTLGEGDGRVRAEARAGGATALDAGAGSIVSAGGGLAAALGHLEASAHARAAPGSAAVGERRGGRLGRRERRHLRAGRDDPGAASTFGEAVNVDTTGGTPRLKIKMDPTLGRVLGRLRERRRHGER